MKHSSRPPLVVSERSAFYLFMTLSFIYFVLYFLLTPLAYYFFDGNIGYIGSRLNRISSFEASFLLSYALLFFLGAFIPFSMASSFRQNCYFLVKPLPLNYSLHSFLALILYSGSTLAFLPATISKLLTYSFSFTVVSLSLLTYLKYGIKKGFILICLLSILLQLITGQRDFVFIPLLVFILSTCCDMLASFDLNNFNLLLAFKLFTRHPIRNVIKALILSCILFIFIFIGLSRYKLDYTALSPLEIIRLSGFGEFDQVWLNSVDLFRSPSPYLSSIVMLSSILNVIPFSNFFVSLPDPSVLFYNIYYGASSVDGLCFGFLGYLISISSLLPVALFFGTLFVVIYLLVLKLLMYISKNTYYSVLFVFYFVSLVSDFRNYPFYALSQCVDLLLPLIVLTYLLPIKTNGSIENIYQ